MIQLNKIVQAQRMPGDPLTIGDATLTPQAQAVTVRWPKGGLVWNRPVAVVLERGEHTARLPIIDVTRAVQWSLLALSFVFMMVTILLSIQQRRKHNER